MKHLKCVPKILGPGPNNSALYGLYLYQKECFLITYHDYDVINQLGVVISSKTPSAVIELTKIPNWENNLVDNDVCANWGISNKQLAEISGADADIERLQQHALHLLLIIIQLEFLKKNKLDLLHLTPTLNLSNNVESFFTDPVAIDIFQSGREQQQQLHAALEIFAQDVLSHCYWCSTVLELDSSLDQLWQQHSVWSELFFYYLRNFYAANYLD